MRVLVLNAGSSSLKASVLESADLQTVARTAISLGADATSSPRRRESVQTALRTLAETVAVSSVQAVGHRVVHGGSRFRAAVRVDAEVLRGIEALGEFAPLHNRVAAETIKAAQLELPATPAVAAFDTAFHATLPEAGYIYPLPFAWYRDWGIRRYGFHGLSVAWAVQRAGSLLGKTVDELALVVAHLGSGCSVTAVLSARSVDTSMGLTPMEGLMMGTRAGSIDPGILLYAVRSRRANWQELEEQLDHDAGLVGVSGQSAGMRELEQLAETGDERARLAIDIFVRKAAAGIGAAATALPRLDGVVFTGGIGEHSVKVRAMVVARLAALGFDPISMASVTEDAVVSRPGARPAVLRVEAREDAIVARETERVLTA